MRELEWWMPEYGFFGDFYIEGDNSTTGYLQSRQQNLAERVQTEVSGIESLLKLKPGMSILDLPCGYGRHSIELAKRGYSVVGCDINEQHLNRAKIDGQAYKNNLDFCKGNMLDFSYKHKFDVLTNMFYSFGFFETDQENMATLKNFYDNLKPGGQFLFHTDVNISRIISGKYKEYEERPLQSGGVLKVIDKYDPKTRRVNGKWIIQNDGVQEREFSYSVRVYEAEEFTEMCENLNFTNIRIYGDWDGRDFTEDSEDMIIIVQKPK